MRVWMLDQAGCHIVEKPDWTTLLGDKKETIWVDLVHDEPEGLPLLSETFKFHPLAVEDTFNERQRPKVEEYEDHLFAILNPVQFVDHELTFRELDVFLGENLIVTVHDAGETLIQDVQTRVDRQTVFRLPMSAGYIFYLLLDTIVDAYTPLLDKLDDRLDEMSETILERPKHDQITHIFSLRRSMSEMARVINQQRGMFAVLTRDDVMFIDQQVLGYYLRDVADHLVRVNDTVNSYRDTVSSLIDLYVSSSSNRLSIVVRRLTVITIGSGVLAVITGFYGMNFESTFPPFSADWGVSFVLLMMLLAIVIIGVVFWFQE